MPSMSKAGRETKWISRSTRCAGQIRPPVQRRTASPSRPHRVAAAGGAVVGEHVWHRVGRAALGHHRHDLRDHVAGALHDHRVADADVLARDLVLVVQRGSLRPATPPTFTGSSSATGVSAPVRPTWMWIARSTVVACSAGNFYAIAQRGARPTKPSRRCKARSLILYTTPSMS